MISFGQDILQNPQYITTSNPKFYSDELRAGIANLPDGFRALYFQRHLPTAPPLSDQFDADAQAIYSGLDPKSAYFPLAQQAKYPSVPPAERAAIASALNTHGAQGLRLARAVLALANVEWLSLASQDKGLTISHAQPSGEVAAKVEDELGYIRRHPATDWAVVGPRSDRDGPLTLAMGAADCLVIPLVDRVTGAFGLVHAGRPGTGLRTAEKATGLMHSEFGSNPKDLVAFLGEGVCMECYDIDTAMFASFTRDFGGRTMIDKVVKQYPTALADKGTPHGDRVAIDLYAFNKYLLAARGVGTIITARNCTARLSADCPSLAGRQSPPSEEAQLFFSPARAKGKKVGWTMENGEKVGLDTFHLGTPRNLATVTRLQ
ncbi:MAG: laccase domain-containing protein [Candidatus Saccharibacteria bacterium]